MTASTQPIVLIVEDEPAVAESYELWLAERYDIRRAESGDAALSRLENVDVVLLDRMMPGMSGDEVLETIRERKLDCRVVMVTAVDPGFDIIEMGFDAYITKPPDKDELRSTIDRVLFRGTLDAELQELFSLEARRSALESEFSPEELASSDEYATLIERIDRQRAAIDTSMTEMESDLDFVSTVREILGEGIDRTSPDDDAHDEGTK